MTAGVPAGPLGGGEALDLKQSVAGEVDPGAGVGMDLPDRECPECEGKVNVGISGA